PFLMEVGMKMLILITYDVSTSSSGGAKRLRRVAKICQDYGQRVQNSVFECIIDSTQYTMLKKKLLNEIDFELDSIRFYRLGNSYGQKIEHCGAKESIDLEGSLLFYCEPQANINSLEGSHPKIS